MGRYDDYEYERRSSSSDSQMWIWIILGVCAFLCIIPIIWCMCYKCRTRGPITPLPAEYPRQPAMPVGTLTA
ncbi:hypothetical protein PRIPAC_89618 [Pristionchus pacificus]|uniref:Uncharacterized protein n=1 Tax=Pristionchus pacificus TaxID=54126 RepID=A0A2A6CWV6_PRIPA|nr:hypothetical protein PRIPAC_89618 [Pristionchus pacificus]|eukprot:PDM82511.1 hypothetical protein PRIPAC_36904 [Pristionchus pacificus]